MAKLCKKYLKKKNCMMIAFSSQKAREMPASWGLREENIGRIQKQYNIH